MLLRKTGSPSLGKLVETAQRTGIPVQARKLTGNVTDVYQYVVDLDNADQINITKMSYGKGGEPLSEPVVTHDLLSMGVDYKPGKFFKYQVMYEDPFRLVAGRFLARAKGWKAPELIVWPGDGTSLVGPIPGWMLKTVSSWDGRSENSLRFTEIRKPDVKLAILLQHTYWGRMIVDLQKKPGTTSKGVTHHAGNVFRVRKWAAMLEARLLALLQGKGDPLWGPNANVYATPELRSEKGRAVRLLELLKTVDGIFMQRFTAVPEEKWTWRKFDLFTLKNLSCLIGDEFYDGDVRDVYHDVRTRFSELKEARKTFKKTSNMNVLEALLADRQTANKLVPEWLRSWLPIWKYTRCYEKPFQLLHVDAVLCQSRGAGQPPALVKMQSKRKFLKTVSEAPEPLTDTEKMVLRAAIKEFDDSLSPEVFTGLDTKARVTLNANACWEKTQADGGTLDAISELVHLGSVGKSCYVRDLFTGAVTEELKLSDTTAGTYVFWTCLDIVLKNDPSEIRQAALVMVSEPGKARTVTKASAALKIVLDVVNKICSYPMSKIPSSRSGMSKSSHAWNSFKSAWTAEGKDYVFNEAGKSVERMSDGSYVVTKRYRELWNSSTDFEEATDSLHHEVASMLGNYWMHKCGIPPLLQAIVRGTCYVPREIVFEAYGPMSSYGQEWTKPSPFRSPRFVTLRRGVLMGDPLTKVVLHLVNIMTRTIGASYASTSFIEKVFPMESSEVKEYIKDFSSSSFDGTFIPSVEGSVSKLAETSLPPGLGHEAELNRLAYESETNFKTSGEAEAISAPYEFIKPQLVEVKRNVEKIDPRFSNWTFKNLEKRQPVSYKAPGQPIRPTAFQPQAARAFTLKSVELQAMLRRRSIAIEANAQLLREAEEKRRVEAAVSMWNLSRLKANGELHRQRLIARERARSRPGAPSSSKAPLEKSCFDFFFK
jgi:hypothetical protein